MRYASCVIIAALRGCSAAAGTLQWQWTSPDPQDDSYMYLGPDGPWQAVLLTVGSNKSARAIPFYPHPGATIALLPTSKGGVYDPAWSDSSIKQTGSGEGWAAVPRTANPNETISGESYFDNVQFLRANSETPPEVNISIAVTSDWYITSPADDVYTPPAGFVGLNSGTNVDDFLTLTSQLKSNGDIRTNSFGMHIGSAPLKQPGSLVLGGYEQNRALGDVAVFDTSDGKDLISMVDLTIGVEEGDWPFDEANGEAKPKSVWKAPNSKDLDQDLMFKNRLADGGALVAISPLQPYILLPPGNCEAIAKYLPVTWQGDLELYTWNTKDSLFETIVNSPAYLGFTFKDDQSSNHTIKVPFKLLNLTLESPLVKSSTQYFPCRPHKAKTYWPIGRAFLQAAFYGYNFEKNVKFLAQAPGPDMGESVIRTMGANDRSMKTNAADSFQKTWASSWTVFKSSDNGSSDGGSDDVESKTKASKKHGLSGGAIAGIVIGVVLGLAIASAAAFMLWKRHRRQPNNQQQGSDKTPVTDEKKNIQTPYGGARYELDEPRVPQEMASVELRHELA